MLLSVRQNWSEDRVFFLDEEGCQHSLPVGWTDAAGPDVFVTAAAGRCPFLSRSKIGFVRLTWALSRRQAARMYSLMRPLRIGFRRIRWVLRSVTVMRGMSCRRPGMRWAMPWCGRAVL